MKRLTKNGKPLTEREQIEALEIQRAEYAGTLCENYKRCTMASPQNFCLYHPQLCRLYNTHRLDMEWNERDGK